MRCIWLICLLGLLPVAVPAEENKTVLGPNNIELYEGAQALRAGDVEDGVRLTLLGLSHAANTRERQTARSNLCAGYFLLDRYEQALDYCDAALEVDNEYWRARSNRALIYIKLRRFAEADADLLICEKLRPGSATVRGVRRMYLDATNPVAPSVTIDDRRDTEIEAGDGE